MLHAHFFFSFFLWWSHKCSQFFGGMALTAFTSQQTLPEVCSEQDEMDFLMEALIIRYSLRGFLLMVSKEKKSTAGKHRIIYSLACVQKRSSVLFSPDGILVAYKVLLVYLKQDNLRFFRCLSLVQLVVEHQ